MESSSEFTLPPFYCPLPAGRSSLTEAAGAHALEWMASYGFCDVPVTRDRIHDAQVHRLLGLMVPRVENEEVFLTLTCFTNLVLLAEDLLFDASPPTGGLSGIIEQAGRVMRVMESPGYRASAADDLYTLALVDVMSRMRAESSPARVGRLIHEMRRCFAGAIRGINAVQHLGKLTEDQYLSIRLDDVAGHLTVVIIEMCGAEPLADDAWQSPAVLACLESAGMVGALDNDLFSYRKESVHDLNLINVLQETRGLSLQRAVDETMVVRDRVMQLFLRLRDELLVSAPRPLRYLLVQLGQALRGHVEWGLTAPRHTGAHAVAASAGEAFAQATCWADSPSSTDTSPPHYPSISWWWDQIGRPHGAPAPSTRE
ncbi:terpene synthase family protein [Streptomyces sp. NPDC002928]|uniref:terpene synthase family protein n=1 Tax=Streptomyces sp. NPDC002928 TaxID=3154440 RepID=UPI0033B5B680